MRQSNTLQVPKIRQSTIRFVEDAVKSAVKSAEPVEEVVEEEPQEEILHEEKAEGT